jgi:oligoendopeptidase F
MEEMKGSRLRPLPQSALEFADWEWKDVEAHYAALSDRLLSEESVDLWLADWSRLKELIEEGENRLYVEKTLDTVDEARESRFNAYLEQIYTPAEEQDQKLKEKLLNSGLEPDGFAVPLRNLRTQSELFREANLPLLEQEKKLSSEYDKIRGAQTVEWEGEEITIDRLFRELEDPDRKHRERAWRLGRTRLLQDRQALNELWVRSFDLRAEIASNADLPDFRSYRWQQLLRFDYTPEDCRRFHEAIAEAVVPAASRVVELRKKALGLDSVRPWDLYVDKLGREPLRPFAEAQELIDKCSKVFHRVDGALGAYFDTMQSEGLLDLDNRKGKAPGGYAHFFPAARRPFIFMNAVGMVGDVQTLLHEGGHAFHGFEAAQVPYYQQLETPMEFNEVASMAMELLAAPYLTAEQGGFFSEKEAARVRIDHLEWILLFWPYMAIGDAFQHQIYENPELGRDPASLDRIYAQLWGEYMPFVDWRGLDQELEAGWQRVLHFFQVPFYYVEYGLAQLGAVQIWGNAIQDQAAATRRYRKALSLAATVPLPELYQQAGAKFAFDDDTVRQATDLIESELEKLRPVGEPEGASGD